MLLGTEGKSSYCKCFEEVIPYQVLVTNMEYPLFSVSHRVITLWCEPLITPDYDVKGDKLINTTSYEKVTEFMEKC